MTGSFGEVLSSLPEAVSFVADEGLFPLSEDPDFPYLTGEVEDLATSVLTEGVVNFPPSALAGEVGDLATSTLTCEVAYFPPSALAGEVVDFPLSDDPDFPSFTGEVEDLLPSALAGEVVDDFSSDFPSFAGEVVDFPPVLLFNFNLFSVDVMLALVAIMS